MKRLTQQLVSCKSLFELEQAKEHLISEDVLDFLLTKEFPWHVLGAPLFKFIEDCIDKIPKEERIKGNVSQFAYLEQADKIVIGEGAVIEPGVYISGPVFIESHALIRHGAYLRGPVYISQYAIVGHSTECKGSLFLPHAKAPHMNYIGDSILGYNCNLGAGTKLANLKLNHSNIFLHLEKQKLDTQLRKFGSIIGNRSSLGCNSVANPGCIFLPDSTLLPNDTALGIIPSAKHK